jgi:Uma2 family endonuclease
LVRVHLDVPVILAHAELLFSPDAEHVMGMPAPHSNRWTLAQVRRLIDRRPGYAPRYELVDGELLVTPAPNGMHQRILAELYALVREYVNRERLGEARFSPATVTLAPESHLEPDLFVIPAVDGRRAPALAPVRRLLLAAEVLSPSSVRHDGVTKRAFFQRQRVPEYWIVDGSSEVFHIWHPDDQQARIADTTLVWTPEGAAAPFVLDVAAFFAAVRD